MIADIDDLMRIVGRHIRIAREEQQMTQEALAKRVGAFNAQVISKYEKGHVMPENSRLIKIAIVLNRDLAWFFESDQNGRAT